MEPEEEMAVDFGVSRRHNVIQYRIRRLFYISLFFQFIWMIWTRPSSSTLLDTKMDGITDS